jgi:peptidoglycan/xylan/chitin deacetylase (PgdA/CDA1 family)
VNFHHHILSSGYYPIKIIKSLGRSLGLFSQDSLRVLLYHDIAPSDIALFESQLRWLSKSWNFISVDKFSAMALGDEPIRGRNLLLTFDDGFASNRVVAEKVLNPMGIKALFFVVSDFMSLYNHNEALDFISRNIQPGSLTKDLPNYWKNMTWADLEALLEQGHSIGSHTKTHARLSHVIGKDNLEKEIISSADTIEARLGIDVDHFSYTFGNLHSFNDAAMAVAKKRFRFIYSGLRGDNVNNLYPFVVQRDSAATQDSRSNYSIFTNRLLGSFLEGAADIKYEKDNELLNSWISDA